MNIADTLRKVKIRPTIIVGKALDLAKEPAATLAGLGTIIFGAFTSASGHIWIGTLLTCIGLIALGAARDARVERARYEAFKEGILSLLNNNGANIKVTYHDGGATISIPKGDAK